MIGDREPREIIADRRARRIRQEELLARGLEGEHDMVLQQGVLQRASRAGHVGRQDNLQPSSETRLEEMIAVIRVAGE
jgi:hypothetical protein